MSQDIRIDPEFQAYVPPLAEAEFLQLTDNLLADGCRDPLVVWDGILIDGHNRFEICSRLGLHFDVVEKDFADRDAALDWMDAHQLGRRNLSPDARKLLLGRRYNRLKKTPGGTGANQHTEQTGQNEPSATGTAAKLAAEHGVSEATVKRAGKFAERVEADDELKAAVSSGRPVASLVRERLQAEPTPEVEPEAEPAEPHDPERAKLANLTTEAMIDEIVGLRADLADEKAKSATFKAERDDLKAKLAEATSSDLGKAVGLAQRRADTATVRMRDHMGKAKNLEFRLNKALARVAELEAMPVSMA